MRLAALFAAALLCAACSDHAHEDIRTIEVEDIPKEVKIPQKLWDEIQGKAPAAADGETAGAAATELGDEGGVLFMPVDVILEEKNEGVLKESPVRIRLPRGGGAIDLSTVVTDNPGSFYVRFEWPDVEDASTLQAWFVSKARRRKLGDEIWGTGCRKFLKITKGLQAAQKKGGIKVNTTRDRHVTVLGGHFVFSARKSTQVFAAQVTFVDPRHPDFYCEEM